MDRANDVRVVHLLERDLAPPRRARFEALTGVSPDSDSVGARPAIHVLKLSPPGRTRLLGWLTAAPLRRRLLPEFSPRAALGAAAVFHAWSPALLPAVLPLIERAPPGWQGRLIVEVGAEDDPDVVARWLRGCAAGERLTFVCPTECVSRGLLERGVPPERCALIRPAVDYAALRAARRPAARESLGLAESDEAIVALPPERAGGAFLTTWAAMLVHKIRPGVRVLLRGAASQTEKTRYLARCCGYDFMVRIAPAQSPLALLLAAADVAAFLPEAHTRVDVDGVMWAMAAGVPLVASATPDVAEYLAHGHNASLCKPGQPRDAARRLLGVLEDRAGARNRAATAHQQAFRAFSRQTLIEEYHRLYANLAAARTPQSGIRDAARRG